MDLTPEFYSATATKKTQELKKGALLFKKNDFSREFRDEERDFKIYFEIKSESTAQHIQYWFTLILEKYKLNI